MYYQEHSSWSLLASEQSHDPGEQYVKLCVVVFADSFVDFDVYENLMDRDGDSRRKRSQIR